jgi:hypothetical protein
MYEQFARFVNAAASHKIALEKTRFHEYRRVLRFSPGQWDSSYTRYTGRGDAAPLEFFGCPLSFFPAMKQENATCNGEGDRDSDHSH